MVPVAALAWRVDTEGPPQIEAPVVFVNEGVGLTVMVTVVLVDEGQAPLV